MRFRSDAAASTKLGTCSWKSIAETLSSEPWRVHFITVFPPYFTAGRGTNEGIAGWPSTMQPPGIDWNRSMSMESSSPIQWRIKSSRCNSGRVGKGNGTATSSQSPRFQSQYEGRGMYCTIAGRSTQIAALCDRFCYPLRLGMSGSQVMKAMSIGPKKGSRFARGRIEETSVGIPPSSHLYSC